MATTFIIQNISTITLNVMGTSVVPLARLDLLSVQTSDAIKESLRYNQLFKLLFSKMIIVINPFTSFANLNPSQDDWDFWSYCGFLQGNQEANQNIYPFTFTSDGYLQTSSTNNQSFPVTTDGYLEVYQTNKDNLLFTNDGYLQVSTGSNSVVTANIVTPTDSTLTQTINSTLLPDGYAFTSTEYMTFPSRARRISWIVKYTSNSSSALGQCKYRLCWKFGDIVTDGYEPFLDVTNLTISEPRVAVKSYNIDIAGPKVAASSTNTMVWVFDIPPGATGSIMQLAEMGDSTNKGTVSQWWATSEVM